MLITMVGLQLLPPRNRPLMPVRPVIPVVLIPLNRFRAPLDLEIETLTTSMLAVGVVPRFRRADSTLVDDCPDMQPTPTPGHPVPNGASMVVLHRLRYMLVQVTTPILLDLVLVAAVALGVVE